MTVAVGDVLRVVAEWDIPDGTIAQLVYHFIGVSGSTATNAQAGIALLAALEAAWLHVDSDINGQFTGSVFQTSMWDFTLNRFDGIDSRPIVAADGLGAGDSVSHGVALLIKAFTTSARRQGRKYLPGIREVNISNGTFVAAQLTDGALFMADLDDDVVAGGLTLSYCTFNTEPTSPLFETAGIANQTVQAEAISSYQRRRRPGTGI